MIHSSMRFQWADCDRESIALRYDNLAPYIKLWEWILWIPTGLRQQTVDALTLNDGDHVLEIGCGTGRNLRFLQEAAGPNGHVYGVDFSPGMLAKARTLRDRKGWANVSLVQSEALQYAAPQPLDGVLFCLSYNTMPHCQAVLRHALTQLRPGGRIVITDARLPPGERAQMILPFSLWLMKRTFLGNPLIKPWEHLAKVSQDFEMRSFLFDSYYICRGIAPQKASSVPSRRASLELIS